MPYEIFAGRHKKTFKPMVSIFTKGQIGFNRIATKEIIKNQTNAFLYYDKIESKIGIKFTNDPKGKGAYKILYDQRNQTAMIHCVAFLEWFGIDYSKPAQHTLKFDETNNTYSIQL